MKDNPGTYNFQLCGVGGFARGIFAMATVVSGMSVRHTLDGQDTAPSAHFGYQYVLVIVIKKRLLVKGPTYIQGQITLSQGALVGYILAQVRGLSTRGKGRYLGQYFWDMSTTEMINNIMKLMN